MTPLKAKTGEVRLGALTLSCAVLIENGRPGRPVLSANGIGRALGDKRTGLRSLDHHTKLPPILASGAVFSSLSADLTTILNSPILYQREAGGVVSYGYEAKLLPDICMAIIRADRDGLLRKNQRRLADAAYTLIGALAGVGIDALVYDACRIPREYGELQKLLDSYLTAEARKWSREFPASFYAAMAKCRPRQRLIGAFINYAVYERMPVPLLPEFERLNPRVNGRRKRCNHQHVSEQGLPVLREHIAIVTALMEVASDATHFEHMLIKKYPRFGDQLKLGIAELPAGALH